MPLQTVVKISSITNLHDARYCAGMGVEMLGFCLNPALPAYISPQKFQEVVGWITGIAIVAELPNAITELPEGYHADYLQIDNLEMTSRFAHLQLPFIYRKNIGSIAEITALTGEYEQMLAHNVSYLLLESDTLDTDSETLNALKPLAPLLLLGFGIHTDTLHKVLEILNPAGIAQQGSTEIQTGINEMDDLAEIIEALDEN
jgi:phosphoribosylanthranilate isomerase